MEGGCRLIIEQHLVRHVDAQGLLAVAEGQGELAAVGFAGGICDIGRHHEVVEHRMTGLGDRQRHPHGEGTVGPGLCRTTIHLITIGTVTQRSPVPIAAVRPPPIGRAAYYLITDLGTLYRHAGITHGRTLHGELVASSIGFLHLGEVDMECRTLVFLHSDIMALVVDLDGKPSGKSGGRQGEVNGSRTVLVGGNGDVLDLLVVRITEGEMHVCRLTHSLLHPVAHLIHQGGDVNGLSRTIEGTVGIDVRALYEFTARRIAVAVVLPERRTGLVAVGIDEHLPTVVSAAVLVEILALGIGHGVDHLIIGIVDILLDAQMGISDGLTCRGIDNRITDTLA